MPRNCSRTPGFCLEHSSVDAFSLPLAMIGAMTALAITGKSLSIFTMLGIIMLMGLVAKNAILLVDRANQVRDELGMSVYDALLEAASSRLRPILRYQFAIQRLCA